MSRPRLLLIEDNPSSQQVVKALCDKYEWDVVIACTAEEGLELIKCHEHQFEIVLMDWLLSEMSGLEATRCIREYEKERKTRIPIIAITAHAMTGDREKCLDAGMDDYLSKPFGIKQFEEVVRKWLPVGNSAN